MRASRQPGSARNASSTSAMTGCSAIAGASRSLRSSDSVREQRRAFAPSPLWGGVGGGGRTQLRCKRTPPTPTLPRGGGSPSAGALAGLNRSAANTSLVGTATRGLTSTAGSRGRSSGSERISPMPRISRGRGSRQTGTSAPVARAAAITRGSSSAMRFARARSRMAAAASAEPPPSPAATGRRFDKTKRPSFSPSMRSDNSRAALSTRLSAISPDAAAVGPRTTSDRLRPRVKGQSVADRGEGDQALDVVIAVGAAADDAQRQVDLGGRQFGARSRHAERSAAVRLFHRVRLGLR